MLLGDPNKPETHEAEHGFRRALGPVEAVSIVVGTIIGSGIWLTPSAIAAALGEHGLGAILCVWLLCGLLSLAGALTYAELAAMFPRSGGQYVYLVEAYGPVWGFLFGWMEFWVARAGSIATIAVGFARYAQEFTHSSDPWQQRWIAFLVVFLLTWVNYLGVRWGGAVQVIFTATKVAALGVLVTCAFGMGAGSTANWGSRLAADAAHPALLTGVGLAMIQVLWAYDGWANGAAVSEEMKNPVRDVPRALFRGTAAVMVIYLSTNLAYHYLLPMGEVASAERVAADAAERVFGQVGAGFLAIAVMISTFGAINGTLLTGPRIFYAMARDGHFFPEMGLLHPVFRTPHWAILFQGLWASLLILVPFNEILNGLLGWNLGKPLYDQLLTFVIFSSWAFYGLTVAGVLVLRKKRPAADRPYRTWGYPVVPLLFILTAAAFVLHTLVTEPIEAAAGVGIVLLGLPAYYAWDRRRRPS